MGSVLKFTIWVVLAVFAGFSLNLVTDSFSRKFYQIKKPHEDCNRTSQISSASHISGQVRTMYNDLHPDVNVVPSFPAEDLVLPHRDCFLLPRSPKTGVWICVHPVVEDWVSKILKQNTLWEAKLIYQMDKALKEDSNLMLFDVGLNVGVYTLWAAALGRQVVAVDMLMSNIQLVQTSLHLSGLEQNVTIVNNGLFSDHRTVEVTFVGSNIGSSTLNTARIKGKINTRKDIVKVQTICMDDLLPLLRGKSIYLKMDIENSEHQALSCAHKLFNETNIKFVQMEWNKRPPESDQILQFMNLHGYVMSETALKYKPVTSGDDVYFIKKPILSDA